MTERAVADTGDLLKVMRKEPGGLHRTYVAPEARVLFISLNKNACTSLKWMMADLAGEDLDGFSCGLQPFISADEAVHDRAQWGPASRLGNLDPETRAGIRPDNGWFVFAVIRDPRLRFFSAWQNKILMENPATLQWRSEPWFPRHPATPTTIVEDFAKFTEFMEANPEYKLRKRDGHFRQQVDLLMEDIVPYTKIYEIGEMGQLRADLTAHLDSIGQSRELFLPRANHTPLRARAELFDNGVRESIERMYADDLARFGHLWDFAASVQAPEWTDASLAEIDLVATLSHRMGDLRDVAFRERRRAQAADARVAELEEQLTRQASTRSETPVRRALRRITGAARASRG